MFSEDVAEVLKSICETAKEFAKSGDAEVKMKALGLLERALDMLEDEI